MPNVTIAIGGREFDVACQEGEEHFLRAAAGMLDSEAQVIMGQLRNLTESRMLLMAGLMLADKTAGADDSLKLAERRIAELEAELAETRAALQEAAASPEVVNSMAELAARAEALAELVEEKAAG